MMYHQVVQLLTGARLIARPQGASVKELRDHLDVSRKTVYRLFEALEELGYMLYPDMVGKEARYYLNKELDKMRYWQPLPTLTFDIEDHILLDYVFRKMSENPVIARQAGSLRNKLAMVIADYGYSIAVKEQGQGKSIRSKPVIITDIPVGKKRGDNQDQIFHDMLQTISDKRVSVISYESFSSGTVRTYQIHPLTIFEHNGGLYAFVFQPYYEKIIILALERIKSIQALDERFEIPEGYDAEKRLSDPFGIVLNEEPFIARIWFNEDQARYIQERDWPEGTNIEELEDGSIILNVETAGSYELKKWILGFGESAELLEPDWLRDEIKDDITKIVRRYSHE
jgi:predicted DNA-binding transcriptional regulator YafY